jgi:hypothetical protein
VRARAEAALCDQIEDRVARRRGATLHSWLVVAVAPLSFGLMTFAAFWYAAAWIRSTGIRLYAAGYTVATVLEFVWAGPDNAPPAPGFDWMLGLTFLVGTAHLIVIRGRLSRAMAEYRPSTRRPAPITVEPIEEDPAFVEAVRRQARREQVRELVASNPELATELRVGRPDLDREFDDGGLVDVNEVPASVLATLPGFTPELAEEVVRARERVGGRLFSPEELVVYASLPPDVLDHARDRLLFRPL